MKVRCDSGGTKTHPRGSSLCRQCVDYRRWHTTLAMTDAAGSGCRRNSRRGRGSCCRLEERDHLMSRSLRNRRIWRCSFCMCHHNTSLLVGDRGVKTSGAGTNLKVGGTIRHKAPEKKSCPLHCFGSTSTISRFGERFRDKQFNLLFAVVYYRWLLAVLLLTVPPYPATCKYGGGGTWPRYLRHW